ncbi:PAS domain S-box protein [Candidatus Chloroploca sp. M-50]|uniref:histidine kinase n=1 Tax=Candidatus Chloroploca mongolica TaxID=2528176 RepID=A0ABS4DGD6_9CHLR|nr:PAS domain S-box protein [Candidatus Chloroploca mongolica]MBP1468500.1 PAS domain S-box protein [Candidatus Chloroploca mongolica]
MSTTMTQSELESELARARAQVVELETVIEALDVSLCFWMPDTTLTFANGKYKKIFGVQGEARGQKWINFLPEDARASTAAFYAEVTANPRTVSYEHPVTVEDGRVREYHWIDTPIQDEHDKTTRFLSVGIDITERKQAEKLTAAQRDLAQLIAQELPAADAWAACLQAAIVVSGLDCGGLYLFNANNRAFELVYHQGLSDDFVRAVAHFGEDSSGSQLMLRGTMISFTEAELHTRSYYQAEGLRSLAVIPIQHRGQVLGCLNIASHVQAFIPEQTHHILETIAAEIANVLIHQQTQADLERSHAQLQQTLFAAHMGTWRYDVPGRRMSWSPEAAQIIGTEQSEEDFSTIIEYFHPEDRDRAANALQETLTQKSIPKIEYRMFTASGDLRWVTNYAKFEYDQEGNPLAISGLIQDITERKRVEEARRESDERYHLLFQYMAQGVVFQQADGQIIHANPSAERILGLTLDQMQGRKSIDPHWHAIQEDGSAFPGEEHPAMVSLHTGKPVHNVVMGVYNPQLESYRWININAVPRFFTGGEKPYQVFATFEDITERKQAEDKLRLAEQRYRALIENAPDGIVLMNVDGSLKYASPSTEWIMGFGSDEVLGLNPFELTHPDDRDMVLEKLAELLRNPTYVPTIQYRFQKKNGEWRWIESTFSNLLAQPNVEAIIINFRDIHERKAAEEGLTKSQALLTEAQRIGRIGHMEWNGRDQTLICSDELYDIFELPRGTGITQDTVAQMMLPGEQERVERLDMLAMQQQTDIEYEFGIRTSDGSIRWLHQMGKMTYDEHGMPLRMMAIIQDITERKKTEQTLSESRTRLEMALKGSKAGMWDWNVQTGATIFNERWAEIVGYALHELEPINIKIWDDLCHPDDLKRSTDLLQQHFSGETEFYACEVRMKHKNGSWVWVMDQGKVMEWDEQGNPVRMFGTHLDITRQKREELYTQAILRLTNASYATNKMDDLMRTMLDEAEALTDSTIGFFHFVDDDQNTINLQAWSTNTLLHACTAEAHGQHYPVDKAGIWADAIRSGEPHIYNDFPSLIHQKGMPEGHAPISRMLSLPITRNNLVVAAMGVGNKPEHYTEEDLGILQRLAETVFDIIMRKRVEDELRTSEEKYRLLSEELEERVKQRTTEVRDLYEHAPTGYYSLNADGHVVAINQTALTWLGYVREEVLGASFESFVTRTSTAVFKEAFAELKKRGEMLNIECEMKRKDGSTFPALLNSVAILDAYGNYLQSRSTIFDHTERKHAEDALRFSRDQLSTANTALQKASRAKNEFLANMSHELRTPLNGILGMAEILLEEIRGPLNERQRKMVAVIESSGRHLLSLINDILDLSKIEAGKLAIHIEQIAVADICETSLVFIKEPAMKKGIKVEFDLDPQVVIVRADVRRLKQILINLLSNAVKFTPSKGQVTLQVRGDVEHQTLDFTVIDTGIGIDPEDLKRLFTPFTQVDSSLTRGHEGTGLGLALVMELVELHGGSVKVASDVGAGSTFTVCLPWHNAFEKRTPKTDTRSLERLASGQSSEQNQAQSLGKILLAEDMETNIMIISDYLESLGYAIITAANGQQAIERAQEHVPDLILMDIQMPVMDGLEATRRLRADARFATVPIIAITALTMTGDRERCLEAGATDYISKPIKLKQLGEMIQLLLNTTD